MSEDMHTLPSIEAVPIYIELDGFAESWACLAPCFEFGEADGTPVFSLANLLTASGFTIGRGGGKGDIDTAETLAEWA